MNITVRTDLHISSTITSDNFQVFNEGATYRGKLKDYCRSMFLQYYSDALGLNEIHDGQEAYYENIILNVSRLIGKQSEFHFGPLDSLVSFHGYLTRFSNVFRGKNPTFHIHASGRYA